MRSDGLPIDDVLAYAEQIAAAREAGHAANIVHRDVKPANVMVTESGQVKLLDFGIAKDLVPDAPDAGTMTAAAATRAGVVIGSLGYMAPEQAQGHAVDGRHRRLFVRHRPLRNAHHLMREVLDWFDRYLGPVN